MAKSVARLLSICILFSVCIFSLQHHAFAADFQPISPEEMKIKEVPGHPGAPAIVLYHEETSDDNLHFWEVYMRIKILTEAGREQANVQIPYSRQHGLKVGDIKGRTVHADGSIVNFEGKPFDKTIVKGRDRRYNVKAFTLPDVQIGSIIEYRYFYRYNDESLYAPEWIVSTDLFQSRVHFTFRPYMGDVQDRHGVISSGVKWTFLVPKGTEPVLINEQCSGRSNSSIHSCTRVEYNATNIPPFVEEP